MRLLRKQQKNNLKRSKLLRLKKHGKPIFKSEHRIGANITSTIMSA